MRPSSEQLVQIRRLSNVVYADPEGAFARHGEPETREEASDLLKTLDAMPMRPREEIPMIGRVCDKCEVEKSITKFRKAGRGYSKICRSCESEAAPVEVPVAEPEPAEEQRPTRPVSRLFTVEDDLREALRDPRLSVLESIRSVLDETLGVYQSDEYDGFSLETAAQVAEHIAELEVE